MNAIAAPLTELIETLTYAPGLKGGTDLEAATKTISATSEPGAADYTTIHTIPAPTDARIAVLRGCVRLSVTIDSFGGGGAVLNYRVKNGATSLSTGTLSTAASTGNKLVSFDITANITGAQAYTLFFWTDVGTCVLSEVTLWSGIGSRGSSASLPALSVAHTGFYHLYDLFVFRVGTGTVTFALAAAPLVDARNHMYSVAALTGHPLPSAPSAALPRFASEYFYVFVYLPTVATDLPYLSSFGCYLRSAA